MIRKIGAISVARSDYGLYRSVFDRIKAAPDLELGLFVGGAHLSPEFGSTVEEIRANDDPIVAEIPMLLASDSPESIAKTMALGQLGFAQAFEAWRPDILLVLGDRSEMFSAVIAALPFNIPVAHLYGGELTFGAIDDAIRHAITKLSHLHFAATEDYARRIVAMGEEPWRVFAPGSPSLDRVLERTLPDAATLEKVFDISFTPAPILCTYHPVTREYEQAETQARTLCAAIKAVGVPVIFTMPNADSGGRAIRSVLNEFAAENPSVALVENFGFDNYFGALRHVSAMIGNSSSALHEAPTFKLPVVNIGPRQDGRTRSANVIDVVCEQAAIETAIRKAISPEFRDGLHGLENPYGDGTASEKIVNTLRTVTLNETLVAKRFVDNAEFKPEAP